MTLVLIPSHTGIRGNEITDKLDADECRKLTGNKIGNKQTMPENIAMFRKVWTKNWIECLKRCQKPSVQILSQIKRIDWLFVKDRRRSYAPTVSVPFVTTLTLFEIASILCVTPCVVEAVLQQRMPTTSQ